MGALPDLSRFDRIAVDTETTGLSYTDRPVGCAIKTPDGQRHYLRWGHKLGGNNCTRAEFVRWARRELGRPSQLKVFHNAAFDLRMLAYIGVAVPNVEDTQILAYLHNELVPSLSLNATAKTYCGLEKSDDELHTWIAEHFHVKPTREACAPYYWQAPGDIVEPYALGDVDMTLALYDTLRPLIREDGLDAIYQVETDILPIVLKLHMIGVRVNVNAAEETKAAMLAQRDHYLREFRKVAGDINYNSTQQLATVFERLGLPVWKTKAGNPSIPKELLEFVEHPIGQYVRSLKQLERFTGLYIDNYILSNVGDDGVVHGEFHQIRREEYGTISGRFSSGGALNLQNMPARNKELARPIRRLFIPWSNEHQWGKLDYSQIEYRFFAHYAGGKIREAYAENPLSDFHQMVADLTGLPRNRAKTINFAKLYGAGRQKLALSMGCSEDEAAEFVEQYNRRIPEGQALYDLAMRRAGSRGFINTWGGRRLRFKRRGRGFDRTHKALNSLLQGSAADLMKMAMIRVDRMIDWESTIMHLTVHDELDLSVPKGDAGIRVMRDIKEAMQDYELSVPIISDAELGPTWGDCEDIPAEILQAA